MYKLIKTPNIPSGKVKKVIIPGNISKAIEETLSLIGVGYIRTESIDCLPLSLSRHVDLQLVHLLEGLIVYAPGTSEAVLDSLRILGYTLFPGETGLTKAYPGDTAYNVAVVGAKAFLNPKYADKKVIELLKDKNVKMIPVKQGYTKCSLSILTSEAIITADPSIHKAAIREGMDSLFIPPQRRIRLEGYSYGFIGGTTGLISKDTLAFFGDYSILDSWDRIGPYLKKHGITPMALSSENPVDLGGLIPLCSV